MMKMQQLIGILEKPHVHMEAQWLEEQLLELLVKRGAFDEKVKDALRCAVPDAVRSLQVPLVEIDAGRVAQDWLSTGVTRLHWTYLTHH